MNALMLTLRNALERVGLARRRIDIGDIPPDGRSSVPSYAGQDAGLVGLVQSYITPRIPFALTSLIERAAVYNPDISNAVSKFRNLANSGHQVVLDASEALAERAMTILNEAAYRVYTRSAGVDGLVNHMLDQVIVSGAVSAEDVIDLAKMQVSEVALVPVGSIRYRRGDGLLVPYQQVSSIEVRDGMVKLNETTYAIYAAEVWGDSPYPKSPMTAVLEPLLLQRASMQNIEYIVRKFGLLGLIRVALNVPGQKPGEGDQVYENRKRSFLQEALKAFQANFRQGAMVGYKDHEFEHFNVTNDARGAKDIFQLVEEQMASGMDIDPAMLGRSYSTTETYAGIVYGSAVKNAQNYQRLVRRRIERTYRLELRLNGIEVDGLSVPFDHTPARDPLAEAQAEETKVRTIMSKAERGMIDPDRAAQEAGYDEWFDQEKIEQSSGGFFGLRRTGLKPAPTRGNTLVFKFDRAGQRYRFIRQRLHAHVRLASGDREAARRLEEALKQYREALNPYLDAARNRAIDRAIKRLESSSADDFPDAEKFATELLRDIRLEYAAVMPQSAHAVEGQIAEIYGVFKLRDLTSFLKDPPISFVIGSWDRRTIDWMGEVDKFFFSKFIDNETMAGPIQNFLREQFLENGEGLLGRTSPETVSKFRALFGDRLEELGDHQVKNIINHSSQRMRNWSHGQQMREAGIEYAKVVAVIDDRTSDICLSMHGTEIPVGPAMSGLDKLLELSPDEYLEHLKQVDPEQYKPENAGNIAVAGDGWPPYHPGPCRTRTIAIVK